jgi:hypothetical protein
MGPFRTKSSTETVDEFIAWAEKYKFTPDERGIWRGDTGGRVVFESVDSDAVDKLGKYKLGL